MKQCKVHALQHQQAPQPCICIAAASKAAKVLRDTSLLVEQGR
jgi:hypothetical protein